jgi:hypothetical protein
MAATMNGIGAFMRARHWLRILPLMGFALLPQSAQAWNDTGHRTIGLIAWKDLTPAVQARIAALLRKHPQYAAMIQTRDASEDESPILDFMTMATWPDKIRTDAPANRPFNHDNWHTTVFPFITGSLPADKRPAAWSDEWQPGEVPGNIIQALKKNSADIRDPSEPDDQKAVALAWIVHLTGDIHQPLHTTSWYSEEHPDGEGDKRGNYTFINTGSSQSSLHSYWDSVLPQYVSLEASRTVVAQLKKDFPRREFLDELKDSDFRNWGLEGHELARTKVYMDGRIPHGLTTKDDTPALSKAYQDEARKLGQKRLTLAGYRLADLLDRLFGTSPLSPDKAANKDR